MRESHELGHDDLSRAHVMMFTSHLDFYSNIIAERNNILYFRPSPITPLSTFNKMTQK